MPDYDIGFKTVARLAGRELARLADVECSHWQPVVSEVQTAERLADRTFKAGHGREDFLVYMEAYTYWDAAAPWSILAKSGLLSERERLPTRSLLFVLRPRRYRDQQGQFRLEVAGRPTQHVWFDEVRVWELEPQPWWDRVPGLMALLPLVRHGRQPPEAVTDAAAVIESREPDRIERANLLTILGIFGKLVSPGLDVVGLIGREQMKESPLFKELIAEGRNEGRVEGMVEQGRADILRALRVRHGEEETKDLPAILEAITDPEVLDRLFDAALRADSVAAFRRVLPKRRKRR